MSLFFHWKIVLIKLWFYRFWRCFDDSWRILYASRKQNDFKIIISS
jgi:hypothetical protein